MSDPAPVLKQRFFSSSGAPMAGGKLFTYIAGTTTPQATYTNSLGTTPNTNPIILDSNGQCDCYLVAGAYKFVLQDANNVVQWTVDNINDSGAITDANSSLSVKPAVKVVATTNQALAALPTIDGVTLTAGQLALLTNQTTGSQNGPWVVASGGWTRPSWYPSGGTTQSFTFISTTVLSGTVYSGTTWKMTTAGAITIDTTTTAWSAVPFAISSSTVTGTLPIANGGTGVTSVTSTPAATTFAGWDANKNLSTNALIPGFTTTATAAGTTTLTISATQIQVFTGSSTQTVKLPTTSIAAGAQYIIINQSSGNVTVQSSGANTISTLGQNIFGIFTAAVATPTTAANWISATTSNFSPAFFTSSQVTTGSSAVNSTTFTTASNSPAFSVACTSTGTYKVYGGITLFSNTANSVGVCRIVLTSGSGGALVSQSQGSIYVSTGTSLTSTFTQSTFTLTAGNTYVFDIQIAYSTGGGLPGNISVSGDIAPFYLFAERVS